MTNKICQNSQTLEKGISSNASTSDVTGYRFGSLVPGIGTPIVEDNSKNTEKPSKDPIPEEDMANCSDSDSGTIGSGLDQAIEDIIQAEQNGYMEIDETQILMDYIDSKLAQGLKREDLAKRISSPSQKAFIIRSAKNNKKKQTGKTFDEDFLQRSGSKAKVFQEMVGNSGMSDLTKSGVFQTPIKSTIADNSSMINVSDDEWLKFADEHDSVNMSLDETARAMWQAKMYVKIQLAKNLDKSINSYMGSKRFPKLGGRDSFEKWNRNMNTELSTIPLCAGRLETGALKNPRVEPMPECNIFMDEYDVFVPELFQSAIMLYNLLEMLRDKITKF